MADCELDHLVIAAASLEDGAAFVRDRLGIEMPFGGHHPLMGTHNRLMRLGTGSFLEVIAIDPDALPPDRPRWYALDDPAMRARLKQGPELVTWVVRTSDIAALTEKGPYDNAPALPVTRGSLSWRLTVPEDGSLLEGGVVPHVIQWDADARPWETMADFRCDLEGLVLSHPKPEWLSATLEGYCPELRSIIAIQEASAPAVSARIATPSGIIVL